MEAIKSSSKLQSIKSKVSTSPLKYGGASFRTNVLVHESSSRIIYKPHYGAVIFCFLFLTPGLAMLFFSIFSYFKYGNNFNFVLLFAGLIFTVASCVMIYAFYKPRVFDKKTAMYSGSFNKRNSNNHIHLKDIIAIQIIGENVKGDKGSFRSFELNLVLQDATRKNVVDHGNLKSIIIDAEVLSEFLNVPIWHAGSLND